MTAPTASSIGHAKKRAAFSPTTYVHTPQGKNEKIKRACVCVFVRFGRAEGDKRKKNARSCSCHKQISFGSNQNMSRPFRRVGRKREHRGLGSIGPSRVTVGHARGRAGLSKVRPHRAREDVKKILFPGYTTRASLFVLKKKAQPTRCFDAR